MTYGLLPEETEQEASPGESGASLPPEEPAEGEEQVPGPLPEDVEAAEKSEEIVLTAEGKDYIVTVTYGPDAGIPAGAVLSVRELVPETEEYDDHYSQTQEVLDIGTESDAAGDTFTGYYIAGYTEGMPVHEILRMASKAASVACTRMGAAGSIPLREEVERLLRTE